MAKADRALDTRLRNLPVSITLAAEVTDMPYKIHIENDDPPVEFFGSRIGLESAPIKVVETIEDAKRELKALWDQGITNIYAVGHDGPRLPDLVVESA
jgi:hypothetical protein